MFHQFEKLYSDPQDLPTKDLPRDELAHLQSYLVRIKAKTNALKEKANHKFNDPCKEWYDFARQIITEIILDVMQHYGINSRDLEFQFYLCGSLAKQQATPFSDLDAFVIWEDPKGDPRKLAAIAKMKTALQGMQHLFLRIFDETRQFSPDPIGITPFRYQGTAEELYKKLEQGNVADVASFVGSINSARPLLANTVLLKSLVDKINTYNMEDSYSSTRLYHNVVEHFPGPKDQEKIHLKRDIFRPLDFFVAALRNDFSIVLDNGGHLPTAGTVAELVAQGKMSHEFADLIMSIFDDAIKLRFRNHQQASGENDFISLKSADEVSNKLVRSLIDKVAILRGIAAQRLTMLQEGEDLSSTRLELTDFVDIPYRDSVHKKETMVMDVAPYVYSDPARDYFEQQNSRIRQNLAEMKPDHNGSIERIFSGLESIPTHLRYLSETLSFCFKGTHLDQHGNIHYPQKLELDPDRFKKWCEIFLQNAISDLFDGNAKLHPWIQRTFSKYRPDQIAEAEETNKKLLAAYLSNVATDTFKLNFLMNLLSSNENRTEEHSAVYKIVNTVMSDMIRGFQEENLQNTIQRNQELFRAALSNFKDTVATSIQLLREVQVSTRDPKLIKKITARIQTYETLTKNIDHVVKSRDNATLKQGFLHKTYNFFVNDFKQFENDVKTHEPGLWSWVKEKAAAIWQSLWRGRTEILTQRERVKKLDTIRNTTEESYQASAWQGANSDNLKRIPSPKDSPVDSPENSPRSPLLG